MRKKIVAGNWKCNTSLQEGVKLAREVDALVAKEGATDVVVILGVPFTHLEKVVQNVNTDRIFVAAQNCAAEAKGAFTGEISAEMIKSTGAEYVIIGHSERRAYYHETSDTIIKKLALAIENDLTPIYCCGEPLHVREAGGQKEYVKNQMKKTILNISPNYLKKLIIAYEPIWAVGTGITATPEQAQEIHTFIRSVITEKFDNEIAECISILYGGSCTGKNAKELFAKKDVDGGLIGGASLKAEDFIQIINGF